MIFILKEDIPYDIQLKDEKYYQSLFHVILRLLGLDVRVEVRTNVGRIDAVVETPLFIYIFEFKIRGTAEEALAQIQEKRYAEKYLASGKEIRLVGAAFDPVTRNLETWLEDLPSRRFLAGR